MTARRKTSIPLRPLRDSEVIYWRIPDAADAIGVTAASIRRRLWLRQLRRFKVGSRTVVLKSEVLGLVKEKK
jgi:hypothetical protein